MPVTTLPPTPPSPGLQGPIVILGALFGSLVFSKSPQSGQRVSGDKLEKEKGLGCLETGEGGPTEGGGLGTLGTATHQEVDAVLDLLEAIDVLCLCHPCGGGGKAGDRKSVV